jgi:hypothetical protein
MDREPQTHQRSDTTGRGSALPESSHTALAECVRRYVAAGADTPGSTAELLEFARESRQAGMRAEELVVAIRTAWYEVRPAARLPTGAPKRELLQAIGFALDAYFRDD